MRRSAIGLSLPLLVLLSCQRSAVDAALVGDAAAKTVQAGSARFEVTGVIELPTLEPITIRGSGSYDWTVPRAQMEMDMSEMPLDPAGPLGPEQGRVDAIIDGSLWYLRWPWLTDQIQVSTDWVKFDPETSAATGLDPQELLGTDQSDPNVQLWFLLGATDVESLGEAELAGDAVTRYSVHIDFQRAVEQAPADAREGVQEFLNKLQADEADAEVWIDEQGYVRRFSYEIEMDLEALDPNAPAGTGTLTNTMDLHDLGTEVDVEVPPEDEVTDFADVAP